MIKYNKGLKSLIIYYNNSKTQTQNYGYRYFNIHNKSGGSFMTIYHTTRLLFININHNTIISVEYRMFHYYDYKIHNLDPKWDYFIEIEV